MIANLANMSCCNPKQKQRIAIAKNKNISVVFSSSVGNINNLSFMSLLLGADDGCMYVCMQPSNFAQKQDQRELS